MNQFPVILYIGSSFCPACVRFEKEQYEKLQNLSKGKYRLLEVKKKDKIEAFDPCIAENIAWFPMFMLVSPQEYRLFYDQNGAFTSDVDKYAMRGAIYNLNIVDGQKRPAGKGFSAEEIIEWADATSRNMNA